MDPISMCSGEGTWGTTWQCPKGTKMYFQGRRISWCRADSGNAFYFRVNIVYIPKNQGCPRDISLCQKNNQQSQSHQGLKQNCTTTFLILSKTNVFYPLKLTQDIDNRYCTFLALISTGTKKNGILVVVVVGEEDTFLRQRMKSTFIWSHV